MENKLLGWNRTPKCFGFGFFFSSLIAGIWKGLLPASDESWNTNHEPITWVSHFPHQQEKVCHKTLEHLVEG